MLSTVIHVVVVRGLNPMIKIYTKDNCSYCVKAKQLLNSRSLPYEEVAITPENRNMILETYPAARTAPIIIIDDQYIGGYDQLQFIVEEETDFDRSKGLLLG